MLRNVLENKNNRLTKETKTIAGQDEIIRYGYDDNGNQINKAKEILKTTNPSDTEEFGIGAAGQGQNSINAEISFFDYDGFNQLKMVTTSGQTSTYAYNGDGLRTSKTVNGVTTTHVWDGQNIVLEMNGVNVIAKYIRGVNIIYSENGTGDRKYYLFNAHGDVVQLTSNSGYKFYDYDSFGNEKNPDPNDANVFRYCGEYFDKETGTIYLRARYYDPVIGRFITEDSYLGKNKDPLSLNLYTYCGNNPIAFFDPTGHIVEGDKDILSKEDYAYILAITDLYNKNKDDVTLRDALHRVAVAIRRKDEYRGKYSTQDRGGFYSDSYKYTTKLSTVRIELFNKTIYGSYESKYFLSIGKVIFGADSATDAATAASIGLEIYYGPTGAVIGGGIDIVTGLMVDEDPAVTGDISISYGRYWDRGQSFDITEFHYDITTGKFISKFRSQM